SVIVCSSSITRIICFIFFFFQAEDGIRDRNVTGVQTCALPIYSFDDRSDQYACSTFRTVGVTSRTCAGAGNIKVRPRTAVDELRSEERRVGKECRYRGSTYHEREKRDKGKGSDESGEGK